jgi:hypothetical protein
MMFSFKKKQKDEYVDEENQLRSKGPKGRLWLAENLICPPINMHATGPWLLQV